MSLDQFKLIHETDWNTLIILDACRYDFFNEIYSDYLKGDLQKVESPAGATHEWLKVMFKEQYPYTIYSGHPGVNSKDFEVFGYQANLHFAEIKDLWDDGWDNIMGGSPANIINEEVEKDIKVGNWKGKNILWYMQPHFPWFGETRIPPVEFKDRGVREWDRQAYKDLKCGRYDKEFVQQAYKDNIRYVMEYVVQISEQLEGTTVVTADHGELLMDNNVPVDFQFGHYHRLHAMRPELREVPWLVLK